MYAMSFSLLSAVMATLMLAAAAGPAAAQSGNLFPSAGGGMRAPAVPPAIPGPRAEHPDLPAGLVGIDDGRLESGEDGARARLPSEGLRTWTLRSGTQVEGRVVDLLHQEFTVQRRRGRIYVDGQEYRNLPEASRRKVRMIVSRIEQTDVTNPADFEAHVRRQRGNPRTYTVTEVILERANGDRFGVDFALLSADDRQALELGRKTSLAANRAPQRSDQEQRALLAQSSAMAYPRNHLADQQTALMHRQLQLQAVTAGVTSLWEVRLYPSPGVGARGIPRYEVVLGRDSRIATREALARNPGYFAGPVRKLAGR